MKDEIEDYRITPQEDSHSAWIMGQIRERHPNAIFDMARWNQTIDWDAIEKQVSHIDFLATFIMEHELPPLLFKAYIDLLHTNLQVLRDIFFVFTGFYLDPKAQGEVQEREDFRKLRFWTLRDIEVTTRLREVFSRLIHYDWTGWHGGDGTWDTVEETLRGAYSEDEFPRIIGQEKFRRPRTWCMAYAFAPYENRQGVEQTSNVHQGLSVSMYISSFFSLFFQLSVIYQIEENSLPELVEELIHSDFGEHRIKPWRKDMNVSREEFITKLEAVVELRPWVRGVVAVLEEKQHMRSLFSDGIDTTKVDITRCSNVNNWINVVVIAALIKEYESEQHVVRQLAPFFFRGEDAARDFLNRIRGVEPQMITALVKRMVQEDLLSEFTKSRKLYDVLHKNGLYPLTYQNWNNQV